MQYMSLKKVGLKMLSANGPSFRRGANVLLFKDTGEIGWYQATPDTTKR